MDITLAYKNKYVPDFDSIVRSYSVSEFKSPRRSTVPLLLYWADYAKRIDGFFTAISIQTPSELTACFEYMVPVQFGKGKPSFTDLMLVSEQIVVAFEGKYTEPPYKTVREWLGNPASENRLKVLSGWIGLIERATGKSFHTIDFYDLTYQLLHRLASACHPKANKRFLVYQCFGADAEKELYYKNQLSLLQKVIGETNISGIFLFLCDIKKSDEYGHLEYLWDNGERDLSEKVQKGILERQMLSFALPEIIKIS